MVDRVKGSKHHLASLHVMANYHFEDLGEREHTRLPRAAFPHLLMPASFGGCACLERYLQVGLVLGTNEMTMKELHKVTGCRIQIPPQADLDSHPPTRRATLIGSGLSPQVAKLAIEMLVRDDGNRECHGGRGGPSPDQQRCAPSPCQPDGQPLPQQVGENVVSSCPSDLKVFKVLRMYFKNN